MERHRTHQIDKQAQLIFEGALPKSWLPNEQHKDYGKDYLVEIGEKDNKLTGQGFYVQLKGQEKVSVSAGGKTVRFLLETKYAAYYLDKVTDLPVFLVVVDVNKSVGWYFFLQAFLNQDQAWRSRKNVTIPIPAENVLSDSARFRKSVENAKERMVLLHPPPLQGVIDAHCDLVKQLDPRFDVRLSLMDNSPIFEMNPAEPVEFKVLFDLKNEGMKEKLAAFLDRGELVEFKPGEVKITGTKVLEGFEESGGLMRGAIQQPAALSLTCKDSDSREVGRLPSVQGHFTGGRKVLRFEGDLPHSPVSVEVGPFTENEVGGPVLRWKLDKWEGQPLLRLAYFDKVFQFFNVWQRAAHTDVEIESQGNVVFMGTAAMDAAVQLTATAALLLLLEKARKVAQKFNINPVWNRQSFNAEFREDVEKLHAIFFEGGHTEPMPEVKFTGGVDKGPIPTETLKQMQKPCWIRYTAAYQFSLLGQTFEVGRLTRDFAEMTAKVPSNRRGKPVKINFTGSKETICVTRAGDLGNAPFPPEKGGPK